MKALRRHLRVWTIPFVAAALIVLGSLGLVAVIGFGLVENDLRFGYYGRFNRARAVISRMEGLCIVNTWKHCDVSLEDFGFVVRDEQGRERRVDFLENSPQMRLERDEEIARFVRESLAAAKPRQGRALSPLARHRFRGDSIPCTDWASL